MPNLNLPRFRPPPPVGGWDRGCVLLHDEPIVVPSIETPARQCPALLTQLLQARTAEERRRHMWSVLHSMGFDWLGYGQMRQVGQRPVPLAFCTAYADAKWVDQYFRQRHHTIDPRLHRAMQSCLPDVWTIDELADRQPPGAEPAHLMRFIDGLHRSGARSGVMMMLPDAGRGEWHVVSLLSRTPNAEWIDESLLGRVLTLALCLHELYTRHARWPEDTPEAGIEPGDLSTLQREILACVARGMPDKVIASQLNLSPHNVDYHLRRLRKRFGVRNRVQLTQAALTQQASNAA
jgi:DNA-binding CsgD family transcriptional regulator